MKLCFIKIAKSDVYMYETPFHQPGSNYIETFLMVRVKHHSSSLILIVIADYSTEFTIFYRLIAVATINFR